MFKIKYFASKLIFILLMLVLILVPVIGYSAENSIVKVIYLQPQDVENVNHAKYDHLMRSIQEFYRGEMDRHGFGDKTFDYEKDGKGNLIIHSVRLPDAPEHYTGEIFRAFWNKAADHIPFHINMKKNASAQSHVFVVVMGGIPVVNDGRGSPIGGGFTWTGNVIGGVAMVNEKSEQEPLYQNRYESLIAHELGHALCLLHNFNVKDSVMGGVLPIGGPKVLTNFEARLLNKHPVFTGTHLKNSVPEIIGDLDLEVVGADIVRFKIRVKGNTELYHLQLERGMNCIGFAELNGKDIVAHIDVPRSYLDMFRDIKVTVFDVNGNRGTKKFTEPVFPDPINENNKDSTFKFLTLRDEHPDSITPINNELEWVGWENAGSFEKTPNGVAQKLPNWYIHVPIFDEWNSWFYSHAPAQFVYDLSDGQYNRFDARFYMPNQCNQGVTFELICLADGIEVYKSGILEQANAQNKHFQVDFPKGTKEFTIKVTDGGDGIHCDHFAFGEAKVLTSENVDITPPNDEESEDLIDDIVCVDCIVTEDQMNELEQHEIERWNVYTVPKLATKWAEIKLNRK